MTAAGLSLRAVDGILCKLAEDLAHPAITPAATQQINARVADLMAQRAELVRPRQTSYTPPRLFRPPDPLRDDITAVATWCRGIAAKADRQGNDALAAIAPRIAEELERALAGERLAYARVDDGQAEAARLIVEEVRDRGLRRA